MFLDSLCLVTVSVIFLPLDLHYSSWPRLWVYILIFIVLCKRTMKIEGLKCAMLFLLPSGSFYTTKAAILSMQTQLRSNEMNRTWFQVDLLRTGIYLELVILQNSGRALKFLWSSRLKMLLSNFGNE